MRNSFKNCDHRIRWYGIVRNGTWRGKYKRANTKRDERYAIQKICICVCVFYGIHRDKIRNKIFSLLPSCLKIRCTCAFDQLHQARYTKECFSNWIFFWKWNFKREEYILYFRNIVSVSSVYPRNCCILI